MKGTRGISSTSATYPVVSGKSNKTLQKQSKREIYTLKADFKLKLLVKSKTKTTFA
jgi:hypothetical protein